MKLINPTRHKRLNEATGFVLLGFGLILWLSLVSYQALDSSFNTATSAVHPKNLIGPVGSYLADLLLQTIGLASFLLPAGLIVLAWKWIRSEVVDSAGIKIAGGLLFIWSAGALLSMLPLPRLYSGAILPGGTLGMLASDALRGAFNLTGAVLVGVTAMIVALYLATSFSIETMAAWFAAPAAAISAWFAKISAWKAAFQQRSREKARAKREERMARRRSGEPEPAEAARPTPASDVAEPIAVVDLNEIAAPPPAKRAPRPRAAVPDDGEIPIRTLEDAAKDLAPWEDPIPAPPPVAKGALKEPAFAPVYELPATALLREQTSRATYDEGELKDTAGRIKAKFEEFNVFGNVTQINPGPVVTTFEFKPEAGVKYSRITTLSEDLCLGLQAESILIERIPGKPTVGIEVPNTKREVIALRQVLESDEFRNSASRLTISLGKDISGRIKVASLETMPHLLIAGSTGAGKSVMINSMIMSILYKATPDEVRMIMVDPKRVELGFYEGIPHLLTPVITDPKKATNALKNAVLEMERRLRLLAEHGARTIDQFNKKVAKLRNQPRELFTDDSQAEEELKPLPYILILIDELADLMMLERHGVEESVTRLAQMARAVGMHLVLATQRPSVDVITGLIKANFPARISFRVATRVDSRTILDGMGAEHLLGKGDMLFLPPGSSRLVRVHGAYVSEDEIADVVNFWKDQAQPEYDTTYLAAPPADDEGGEGVEELVDGEQDPMYEEAVRLVLEMGKASTSTMQRRLRLGYGRAARILDMMQRDGIIGPPDGSRPREVLKRPDWLREVEDSVR